MKLKAHRKHPLWFAYALHRVSGLALVLFLPFHFHVLALALTDRERLDRFLHWADHPMMKLIETGLVVLLAAHLLGGLRLMAFELLPWSGRQKSLAALAVAGAFCVGGLFLFNAV